MTRFVVAFVAAVALAACLTSADRTPLREREGHAFDMRPQLGHFKKGPFIDLYKNYAAALLPKDKTRDNQDYRNYMPSQDECITFFRGFRANNYELADLDEVIVLDACLGYLYDPESREYDEERPEIRDLEELPELYALYHNTKINQLEQSSQCVADLLLNVVLVKKQFPNVACNNHWIQLFLQFAECQKEITDDQRQSDSYLVVIYNLVRERVQSCVEEEKAHIETAVRKAYENQPIRRFTNSIKIIGKKKGLAKGENVKMWPHQVTRLLSAVQNTSSEVNLREVHRLIRGVLTNDPTLKNILLANIAEYATKKYEAKPKDPKGVQFYNQIIDDLCNYFRSSDSESEYDFATPFIRLVQLLKYESLFGINHKQLIGGILTKAKETAPLYLSVQACNILTFTDGAIVTAANTKPKYNVQFKVNTNAMILWPDAGYY